MRLTTKQLERAAKAVAQTTGTSDYRALLIVAIANINERETAIEAEHKELKQARKDFWQLEAERIDNHKRIMEYEQQVGELQTALAEKDKEIENLQDQIDEFAKANS